MIDAIRGGRNPVDPTTPELNVLILRSFAMALSERLGSPSTFSFAQARALVGDLQKPNAKIYWIDFLSSIITGHIAFHALYYLPKWYPDATWLWPAMALAFFACVTLYMRSVMFIHELVHLPRDGFRGFRVAWNALCGIFLLLPSFLYHPHVDHHRRQHYGTEHDGEYLRLGAFRHGRWMIVGYIVQALVVPFLGIARFLLISPICWVVPGAREWFHRHASTMVVDPFYQRTDLTPRLRRLILLQEGLCFAWCVWFLIRGGITRNEPIDPIWFNGYAVAVTLMLVNEFRTLGAHRWTGDGKPMSFEDQLLDSVNYPHAPWISELWGPVGTRYHALHHLFPSMPYHNLGIAHRRLMEGLPANSPYRQTVAPSLSSELVALWKRSVGKPRSDGRSHSDVPADSQYAA
jgi:fatty acid desaturase